VPMVSSRERERLAGLGAGEEGTVPAGIVPWWSGAEEGTDGCEAEPGGAALVDITRVAVEADGAVG
jgi:hypothetical protein